LTRARVVTGPAPLAKAVENIIAEVLKLPQKPTDILAEVADMRNKIAAAKSPNGPWDAKIGPGRLQDIELFAQAGALIAGRGAQKIADGLRAAYKMDVISDGDAERLERVYEQCWSLQCAGRLLSASALQTETLGQAGSQFLTRMLGSDAIDAAETQLASSYAAATVIVTAALERSQKGELS